jgi:trehalose synthase
MVDNQYINKIRVNEMSVKVIGNREIVQADGTVYSARKDLRPFSVSPLEPYIPLVGMGEIERLLEIAQRLKGLKLLELSATARGGGVAEMLYGSIPFLNSLGIDAEWKVLNGETHFFECTKEMHNLLQGKIGSFTPEMAYVYFRQLEELAAGNLIDYAPDVVLVHDPQPMGLTRFLRKNGEKWMWRCHIDIEPVIGYGNGVLSALTDLMRGYDASIFSAVEYVHPRWNMPKYVIPPFIDPLSEKNRELSRNEIASVLSRYQIDPSLPIIAQIGRFDPWKGLDRTVAVYRRVKQEKDCQLVIAGGFAGDDPEGERIYEEIIDKTKDDRDIHVLKLSLENREENYREVNALQRSASVIMAPSIREGFGLVVAEALWKGKPVIGSNTGGISFQIIDGYNGYFYRNSKITAQKVLNLLNNPALAAAMGRNGREHVKIHFIMPARVADLLAAIDITMNLSRDKTIHTDCITCFRPWSRTSKHNIN